MNSPRSLKQTGKYSIHHIIPGDVFVRVLFFGCGATASAAARGLAGKPGLNLLLYDLDLKKSASLAFELNEKRGKRDASAVAVEKLSQKLKPDFVVLSYSKVPFEEQKFLVQATKNTLDYRRAETPENVTALPNVARNLKRVTSKGTTIFVVTNPPEVITGLLSSMLKDRHLIGFGAHNDASRLAEVLGSKKPVRCVGLHGRMMPLGFDSEKARQLMDKYDARLWKRVQSQGKITSKECGAFFAEFFNLFTGPKTIVHAAIKLREPWNRVSGTVVSLPLLVKKGKVIGPLNVRLSQHEADFLKACATDTTGDVNYLLESLPKREQRKPR